jgi:hypothetical protein
MNTKDWQKRQTYLFSLIKDKIQENLGFVGELERILGISTAAVYRRVNCTTELKFDELCILCSKFNISVDKIMGYNFVQDTSFKYLAIHPDVNDGYKQYLQHSYKMLADLSQSTDKKFFFTAADIPFYYLPNYPELLYFKLYEQYNILIRNNGKDISYKDFCAQLDKDSIMPLYKQSLEACMHIPSSEIWCKHTISGILQSLKYCFETKCFENKETVLLLLKQLSELINTVEENAAAKSRGKQSRFYLYISPVDIMNNIILMRNGNKSYCDIRLYTANSLFTDNEHVVSDIDKEINNLMSKSILVSGQLKHERCEFFQNIRDQIADLIAKLK